MKMLSITTVDIKKRQKNYPHVVFSGERGFFCVKKRNMKNKVSKLVKVCYPIMVVRNKSTAEVDNE
ncbi:hypothetical protein SAMN05192538_1021 [Bacillus velezensis]|nr:hypothetical protein BCBMB205_40160 [Bacillus velezensis]ARN85457.1 hypothetical protein AAV34_00010 [Bacillus velezensis]ARZ60362.1 hypothetical protein BAGQ_4162 [Bacillus velezensis]KRQ89874.1 hypothetical protein AOA15_08955 [Bacillus velezensis]SDJ22135.1 hypothetical protein SAMN05192538_1021 [Bacillus velezensis]